MKKTFKLINPQVRQYACQIINSVPDEYIVTVGEPNRTLDQNAAQWPILQAFSKQLQWPINGVMCWMSEDEWKDVLTAAFRQESVRFAAGLNGGMVMLGQRTSKFDKSEFSEWLEFLHATAAARGITVYPD